MKKLTQKAYSILRKVAVVAVLMLFVFACPLTSLQAYADETFLTPTFSVDISASEDNSFTVKETIDVDFLYPHHGIYRYIPKNGVRISDIDVPGYRCDVSTRDGHKMLKIGNPETLLTGPQTYEFNYKKGASSHLTETHV